MITLSVLVPAILFHAPTPILVFPASPITPYLMELVYLWISPKSCLLKWLVLNSVLPVSTRCAPRILRAISYLAPKNVWLVLKTMFHAPIPHFASTVIRLAALIMESTINSSKIWIRPWQLRPTVLQIVTNVAIHIPASSVRTNMLLTQRKVSVRSASSIVTNAMIRILLELACRVFCR